MGRWARQLVFVVAILGLAQGCRAPGHDRGDGGNGSDSGDSGWNVDGWDDGPLTTITGTVMSPNSLVPISGAVVYIAPTPPPAIPAGAYPEECVDPPGPHVLSAPDGSFRFTVPAGTFFLVTQKGQFRRVREVTVPEMDGDHPIPVELTTLPVDHGDGDTIPSIAVVVGSDRGDTIQDLLAKLGLGAVGGDNRLIQGTEHFDIYNVSGYEPNTALLGDLYRMLQYHIIFFPCTVDDAVQLNDPTGPLRDATVLDNIRAYLEAGGKIYATDMMYDVFEQPLPEYVDFCGDDNTLNAADEEAWAHFETMSGWTSTGRSVDPDLSAWLNAIGEGSEGIQFLMNFVWIEELLETLDPLPGEPISPKVWVEGDFVLNPGEILPLTLTFPYGSGRVLFSTYHTVDDGSTGILTQEYVLLYLILEIGICQPPLY